MTEPDITDAELALIRAELAAGLPIPDTSDPPTSPSRAPDTPPGCGNRRPGMTTWGDPDGISHHGNSTLHS